MTRPVGQGEAHRGEDHGKAAKGQRVFPEDGCSKRAGERESVPRLGNMPQHAAEQRQETHQEHTPAQKTRPAVVGQEPAQVQPHQQVSHESAHVIEQAERIPGGFSPQGEQRLCRQPVRSLDKGRLSPGPLPDKGDERGKQPDAQVYLQLPPGHFFRPGGKQRHHKIKADKHVHKPQVSGRIIEVKQKTLQVGHRLSPYKGIHQRPKGHRHQNTHRAALEKLARGIVQRELQVTGSDDKQRHTAAAQRLKGRHPEGIGGRQDIGTIGPNVKRFRSMDHHDHEARGHPQIIQPDFPFHAH